MLIIFHTTLNALHVLTLKSSQQSQDAGVFIMPHFTDEKTKVQEVKKLAHSPLAH